MYKTGDIFHCTGHKLISKGIMTFTKSNFSHSAFYLEIYGKGYIIDAQSKGVNLISFEKWKEKWKYKYIVTRPNFPISEKFISVRAMSRAGNTAYDFESLLLRKPIDLITGKWHTRYNEDEKMYCSEYIAWIYNAKESYRMSPKDLYNWCLKNNFVEVK